MGNDETVIFQEFREALGTRDAKTVAAYLTTIHGFVAWLATQPGGTPFHVGLMTETAVRGYLFPEEPDADGRDQESVYVRYPGRAWHPEEQVPPAVLSLVLLALLSAVVPVVDALGGTDQATRYVIMGNLFRGVQQKQREQFAQRGQLITEKVRLYASVGKALIAAKEQAADPYQALEAVVPWEQFVASVEEVGQLARPRGLDCLDFLDDSYSQIRKYSPTLLDTFTFHASPSLQPLVEALELVRDLGRKPVPESHGADQWQVCIRIRFLACVIYWASALPRIHWNWIVRWRNCDWRG